MASSRNHLGARLTPIFTQDLVTPGIFYFGLLDDLTAGDIQSWWIVLRCPEELLPQPFRESKEPSSRAFPFFVPGQNRFIWLERSALYLLHPSQKTAFSQTDIGAEFCDYYDLAVGIAKSEPLSYFERDISEACQRFLADRAAIMNRACNPSAPSRSAARVSPAQSLFISETEDTDLPETTQVEEGPQRKRKRQANTVVPPMDASPLPTMNNARRGGNVSSPLISQSSQHRQFSTSSIFPPLVSSQKTPTRRPQLIGQRLPVRGQTPSSAEEPKVVIKTEAEAQQFEYGRQIKVTNKVSIILGSGRPYPTDRTALEKSPILAAQIQYDAKKGTYVMHPELSEAEPADVLALLDFMQSGQYHPRKCARLDKKPFKMMALAGRTEAWEYSDELIRVGRLYKLAKCLQVKGMIEHLLDKIQTTEYKPYSIMARMQLCVLIFQEPGGSSRQSRDEMELWVIGAVAEVFKQICTSKMEREYFWGTMEHRTAARKAIRDIFAQCAQDYHRLGCIPVDLTLDE